MTEFTDPLQRLVSKHWKSILKFIVGLILFGYVFSQTSLKEIIALLKSIPLLSLIILFLLFILQTMMKALQYWILLKDDTDYFSVLRVIALQNAIANLVSVIAGVASYLTVLKTKQKIYLKQSSTVFITIKAGDLFSIGIFTSISAYFVWEEIIILHEIIILLLSSIFLGIVFLWLLILFKEKLFLAIKRLISSINYSEISIIKKSLAYLEWISKQDHKKLLKTMLKVTLLSIGYLTIGMLYHYSQVKMLNIPIDIWPIIFIISISQILSYLPIHIFGGLGFSEMTELYLFSLFGIFTNLPAALISLRILAYLFQIIALIWLAIYAAQKDTKRTDTIL